MKVCFLENGKLAWDSVDLKWPGNWGLDQGLSSVVRAWATPKKWPRMRKEKPLSERVSAQEMELWERDALSRYPRLGEPLAHNCGWDGVWRNLNILHRSNAVQTINLKGWKHPSVINNRPTPENRNTHSVRAAETGAAKTCLQNCKLTLPCGLHTSLGEHSKHPPAHAHLHHQKPGLTQLQTTGSS